MLEKVIEIVKEASKIMLDDKHFIIDEKDGVENIITTNDVKVQEFLFEKLSKLLPNSSFYCEEGDLKDSSKDYVWIIDPIDGTTNYARHIGVCAISVALEYKGKIIMGIVYNPYQNCLYFAEKGKGAYLNGKRITTTNKPFNECILYTAFSQYNKANSHTAFAFAEHIFQYVNDIRRTGSAAFEICNVAAGKGDLFLEIKLSPWDYAAASLIIKEAGGHISGKDGKAIPLEQPSIVIAANNKENHALLMEHAKKYFF